MARLVTNFTTRLSSVSSEIAKIYVPNVPKYKLIKRLREKATHSQLAHKIRSVKDYYILEMAPPKSNEIQKMQADLALMREFIQSGCFKYLTVRQAWLLFLVCTEVGLWFFMGETIGKMSFVGYKV